MQFDNSYARLPDRMFSRQDPVPVAAPGLIAVNPRLALALGLDPAVLASPDWVAVFAGNRVPEGAAPLAQAYAGHQFGNWVPQLGDGRAVLLGEHVGPDGLRWDVQLKGAGRTAWSRGGDGRAWVGPVIREYLLSEAMHALGVPTTRALAAVTTGETVYREARMPGAVLTRVASSHLRVGTFEYFAARGDTAALRLLADMALARHYPEAKGALGLLAEAVAAQARLVAQWMALGFIHGVMNTDNAHVGGLTIDYGPCAFLDAYHPDRVFSSIDRGGRYAYANQPQIAVWNMAQLASCLLPLIDADPDRAIEPATAVLHGFEHLWQAEWLARFRAKLGLATAQDRDGDLISSLLDRMARTGADFTRTFRGLAEGAAAAEFRDPDAFTTWEPQWQARLAAEGRDTAQAQAMMRAQRANPAIIPRNHRIELAIEAAVRGDFAPFHALDAAFSRPFDAEPEDPLRAAPAAGECVTQTFCGT